MKAPLDTVPHVRVWFRSSEWHAEIIRPQQEPLWLATGDRGEVVMIAERYAHDENLEVRLPGWTRTNSELPEHQVAVVVFARVCAVDLLDAETMAASAVGRAVRDAQQVQLGTNADVRGTLTYVNIGRPDAGYARIEVPVQIDAVRELGVASGDGMLSIMPTSKAYRP